MYQTFQEMINDISSTHEHHLAYQWFNQQELCTKTYHEFKIDSSRLLDILVKDTPKRCHIGIVGPNSYGWVLSYLSVMYSNHVTVPIDRELSPKALVSILNMADIDTLIVIGEYRDILADLKNQLRIRRFIYVSAHEQDVTYSVEIINAGIHHNLEHTPDDTKKILFTSGTTGTSKGVMIREASILENLHAFALVAAPDFHQPLYNLLPMHHVFAAIGDILYSVKFAGTLCINTNPKRTIHELRYFKPASLKVVPLIADAFMRMAELAVKNKQILHIQDFFGGQLGHILCGGALVPEALIKHYEDAGIPFLRGYGLTEATIVVSLTSFDNRNNSLTAIGCPLSCNEVRIENNEIQVKGSNVMIGYYKNPQATAKAFDGEWLKTGDLGYLEENHLYITGRSKNIIILSNGKNIYPEEIEEYFANLPGVDEAFVFEGNLVNGEQVLATGIYSANKNEEAIVQAIMDINNTLPSYKQLNKIFFVSEPLDKTTTRKIKRESSKKQVIREHSFRKIKELLAQVIYLEDDINDQTNLLLDLKLDSFSILDFIARCEDCFRITVDTTELRNIKTIGEMVDFMNDKTNYKIV